jgi:hypothetical protein
MLPDAPIADYGFFVTHFLAEPLDNDCDELRRYMRDPDILAIHGLVYSVEVVLGPISDCDFRQIVVFMLNPRGVATSN